MDLLVSVSLLPTAHRARANGYRAVCRFEGITFSDGIDLIGFELHFVDRNQLEPGETAQARMHFWADHPRLRLIHAGSPFSIYEGQTRVGTGEVVEDGAMTQLDA